MGLSDIGIGGGDEDSDADSLDGIGAILAQGPDESPWENLKIF
jgi:hypothetical protein